RFPETEKIVDGFADGGRAMSIGADGKVSVANRREVLVVDRARDVHLETHLKFARELADLPPLERAQDLAWYVDNLFNTATPGAELQAVNRMVAERAGREVLIGDVAAICGGGVCRHRALLYKVLADEAGLQAALVRGNYYRN